MHRNTSHASNLIKSSWSYTDLKTRIIMPVMIVLALMTAFTGYSFYQSELSRLHEEINLRGQLITGSLSAFATNAMTPERKSELENHIKAIIEDKNLLYQVTIYQQQMPYLTVISGMVRQKLLPDTLVHYTLPIYSTDGKSEVGVIETALSTKEIDDHLEFRVFQIVLVSVVVVIISTILLSMLLSYVVVHPLERLTHKIQAIALGRLNDQVIPISWDEIGHLFSDINHLRVRFREKENDFIASLVNRKRYRNINTIETNCKALVVDDDENILMIAEKLLTKNHIDVITANNGMQALDALNNQKFDIILLDLMMPEMNGFEVLNQLKGNLTYTNTPIIVVSSVTDKESIVEALNNGATDFVIKPFNHDELLARINIHMSKYLSEKEIDSIINKEIDSLQS
ncbi:MAG TPA: response regulator [Gammaproteobacteria bacterium]